MTDGDACTIRGGRTIHLFDHYSGWEFSHDIAYTKCGRRGFAKPPTPYMHNHCQLCHNMPEPERIQPKQ